LAGLLILACAGCHAIFPFDNEEPDAGIELGVDDAVSGELVGHDGPVLDQAMNDGPGPDLPAPDQAVPDATLPDATLPDAALPDAALPDAALPDACWPGPKPPIASTCVDTEGAATNGCNTCPPADDGDCDGLKGPSYPQDPWPWNRNLLLVADGFSAGLGRWNTSGGVTVDTATGQVALAPKGSLYLKSGCSGALPNPDYLTEVRYSMTALPANTRIFNLHTPLEGKLHRLCRVAATSASTKLEISVRYNTTGSTKGNSSTITSTLLTVGSTVILQSWSEKGAAVHTHNCRLLTGDGKKKLIHVTLDQSLSFTSAGTVSVGGDGASYTLDYVRVYKK
jgi:hypothetical protein